MKIYLISQSEQDDYETYDSAIVVAKNRYDATTIHPDGEGMKFTEKYRVSPCWATKRKNIKVTLLGTPTKNQERGVILASFNAG